MVMCSSCRYSERGLEIYKCRWHPCGLLLESKGVFALMILTGTTALVQQDKLKRERKETKAHREMKRMRD